MIKKRFMNILLVIVVVTIIMFVYANPFKESNLKEWQEEVDFLQYQSDIELLQDTLDVPRNTYFDYLEFVELDYTLETVEATLQSDPAEQSLGYDKADVASLKLGNKALYEVTVDKSGYYTFDIDYIVTGTILNNITLAVKINDAFQYSDAKTVDVPLVWKDSTKDFTEDTYGDQTLPRQVKIEEWRPLELYDNTYTTSEPLVFYFEEGTNTIEFENVSNGDLFFGQVQIKAPEYIPSYEEYLQEIPNQQAAETNLFVNAIEYVEKNSSYIRLNSEQDPSVSPYNSISKKLNIIDGQSWDIAGQNVTYNVEVEEAGLYNFTFHYANFKPDFDVFRTIQIDGETPFREFTSYQFEYTSNRWANHTLQNESGNPYKVYLEAGIHTITFRAEKEELSRYVRDLQLLIDHINQFALDIIKITGKEIDRNRTWQLTKYIPETEQFLNAYNSIIKQLVVEMSAYSDKDDLSSTLSFMKKAQGELEKMLEDPDELPLYLNNLYSGSSSVTLLLGDSIHNLNNQEMYLDGFYVSNTDEYKRANANVFVRMWDTMSSFIESYRTEKFNIENNEDTINIWVNRPLTYVDIMQKMVDSSFTPETGVDVQLSVMPDPNKLILANSAGNTPDVALGLLSYMPFDLAIRGALVDLTEFDDYWEVANDFAPGALIPYILEDGVYAVPETLEFNALVYRKDVFRTLDLDVPDTWEDVKDILPTLQRYDMNFYYPISGGTSIKWFYQTSPLIFQYGGSLYSDNGLETTIDSEKSYQGLKLLGDLYTTYSLDPQVPLFYNSFRYNKLPVGIINFNEYLQLKNAAPELVGQWGLAPYPGVYNEEKDRVDRWYVGNGTGGVIFNDTNDKEGAWDFLKWWMSEETQTEFGYTLQSTYGPEYLWLSGNLRAVESSPIANDDKQIILEQISWLRDVPRTPGQYMLERGLSDIWNTVTFDGRSVRVAIDREIITINREIERKMIEFGYLDSEGNILKPYTIRDVDWVQEQMDQAQEGND